KAKGKDINNVHVATSCLENGKMHPHRRRQKAEEKENGGQPCGQSLGPNRMAIGRKLPQTSKRSHCYINQMGEEISFSLCDFFIVFFIVSFPNRFYHKNMGKVYLTTKTLFLRDILQHILLQDEKTADEKHSVFHKKSKKRLKKHKEDQIKDHNTENAAEIEKDCESKNISKLKNPYITIFSCEQQQSYKEDFNAEYDEYRTLHARMESITRRFMKLDAQRKLVSPGSKYQILHEEVFKEYQKIKEENEEKCRCEYLHKKLAHIKRLIGEFDQWQAESWH
uniref:OCEL domain-containing protein n=1 Tax=Anolis carolinensis TaxID=28377 RepID=A0A803SXL2_ANOCA